MHVGTSATSAATVTSARTRSTCRRACRRPLPRARRGDRPQREGERRSEGALLPPLNATTTLARTPHHRSEVRALGRCSSATTSPSKSPHASSTQRIEPAVHPLSLPAHLLSVLRSTRPSARRTTTDARSREVRGTGRRSWRCGRRRCSSRGGDGPGRNACRRGSAGVVAEPRWSTRCLASVVFVASCCSTRARATVRQAGPASTPARGLPPSSTTCSTVRCSAA